MVDFEQEERGTVKEATAKLIITNCREHLESIKLDTLTLMISNLNKENLQGPTRDPARFMDGTAFTNIRKQKQIVELIIKLKEVWES